ncbi:MAG: class I SAM-dependent methyltransferase [Patescibacteria group bacterium]
METREYKIMYEVEDSHFWYQGMRRITKTLLDKYLPKNKQLKILDAGCGTGRNILFLKNYGQVFGIDISQEAIKFCKKRKLTNLKLGNVDKISFKNKSFDVVACFDVLYHKQVKDYKKVIKEFYRILKPGGVLFIRVPAFQFLYGSHDIAVHTKHRFEKEELKILLKNNNFEVLKASYVNCFLFPLAILKRMLDKSSVSDVKQINPILNWLFKIPLFFEAVLIKYFDLPFGLSVIIVAKK